jgi:OPA family glycerol-3-phosphate transporter-like MFS transporter
VKRTPSIWPAATVTLLFLGYAGSYFCRTNLALAKTSLAHEFGSLGITVDSIATINGIAILFYALGKLINGTICDFVGGRAIFIGGMILSSLCTLLFLASPTVLLSSGLGAYLLTAFILIFSLNRYIQSAGWGALVKIATNWFSFRAYGRVMGILCMSYLFGDFLVRQVLAQVMTETTGWREMFLVSASILGGIALLNLIFLRARPSDVGLEDVPVNPTNLHGHDGADENPPSLWVLLKPYVVSPAFWLVLVMSVTLTFVRESSNFFNNDYLKVAAGVSEKQAAMYSSYFPLFGALAVFLMGFTTDRLLDGRRGLLMAISLTCLLPVLWMMAYAPSLQGTQWPVVLVCALGFLSLAPYAFLSGAISMDLGGKRGSSTAAGIVDAIGYAFGGAVGVQVKKWVVRGNTLPDWQPFFGLMFGLVAVTAVCSLAYWFIQERRARDYPAAAATAA